MIPDLRRIHLQTHCLPVARAHTVAQTDQDSLVEGTVGIAEEADMGCGSTEMAAGARPVDDMASPSMLREGAEDRRRSRVVDLMVEEGGNAWPVARSPSGSSAATRRRMATHWNVRVEQNTVSRLDGVLGLGVQPRS